MGSKEAKHILQLLGYSFENGLLQLSKGAGNAWGKTSNTLACNISSAIDILGIREPVVMNL